MNELLSNLATAGMDIISVLVQIIIFTVAYYGLRFIKSKLGVQFAQIFVKSIEQTLTIEGAEKKKIVADLLKKKLGFLFSADDIDHLIEAAVFEMKQVSAKPSVDLKSEASDIISEPIESSISLTNHTSQDDS